MSSVTPTPIRIFRTGTFTSVEGTVVSFGADELAAIVAAYDPVSDPAPFVIGHPKMDDPAFGWAGSLAVEGDVLVAMPDRIEPAFAEAVREGRYAKISAQFYPPDNANNPKPGAWYLKHVGFLGAAAPAVKGLGTVSLADGDGAGLVTLDMTTTHLSTANQETFMPDKPNDQEVSFAERETALVEREAALKLREEKQAKAAADARHADHVSFAEGMVAAATLAPAGKDMLVGLLDVLGNTQDDAATASFGEGTVEDALTPVAAMKRLLSSATPLVSLGEMAPASKAAGEIDPAQLAADAVSFVEAEAKAGRKITVAAAVRHIQKKGA